ncbi:hypothetical protein H0486_04975 [Lachnospiraceae bacterium MD1]|uniref:Bacterial Ig domain-containing protein n=1 Tax=Variimorphobacter saccharofermentans TaxID=2755051 RepID=A0A839JYE0_9FIRM|nr:Ig-like domain-containing protein [Variimorphobacter saccharofermentans]MBB2182227.1 hypothetical protein [Variimorphobacter saccharofermentans]
MKKELIQVALAVTLVASTFTIVPVNTIVNPVKIVYAQEERQSAWRSDPDYKPVKPGNYLADFDNGFPQIYHNISYLAIREAMSNPGRRILEKNYNTEGLLTIRDSSIKINNGDDITEYIDQATSPSSYLDRTQFYYRAGSIDTLENIDSGKATNYYFTAPFTGQLRFRWVANEEASIFTGYAIYDCETGKVLDSDDGAIWYVSCKSLGYGDFDGINVVKGKKYRLTFASEGGNITQKFEMFFIKEMDNNNGKKIYNQDVWYTYTKNEDYYVFRYKKKDDDIGLAAREDCIRVNLTEKSKISVELRALNYGYENWSAKVKNYGVYPVDTLDNKIPQINKDQRVGIVEFDTPIEICRDTFKAELILEKGEYYVPVSLFGTNFDFSFKYNVKPITEEYTPTVTSCKKGSTTIKGKCIKDSVVYVEVDGKKLVDKTTKDGTFSVKTSKALKKGTVIRVYLIDIDGNISKIRSVTVQ